MEQTAPKRMTKRIALLQKAREMGLTWVDMPGVGISEEGLRNLVESGGQIPSDVKVMATEARKVETDEEILKRIETRFRMLDLMVDSSCMGTTRSLIVSGLAGLGKSYPVEQALKKLDPKGERTSIVKGFATAVGLLGQLWDHRHEGQILVIDDADAIFYDEKALNLLKAACDITKQRKISYMAEGTRVSEKDNSIIDKVFDFNGTIIFITNLDFHEMIERQHRMAKHLEALVSRSQYIDISLKTKRDCLIRIKQVAATQKSFLSEHAKEHRKEVLAFIEEHYTEFRELSLRTAIKVANMVAITEDWKDMARVTCFKNH